MELLRCHSGGSQAASNATDATSAACAQRAKAAQWRLQQRTALAGETNRRPSDRRGARRADGRGRDRESTRRSFTACQQIDTIPSLSQHAPHRSPRRGNENKKAEHKKRKKDAKKKQTCYSNGACHFHQLIISISELFSSMETAVSFRWNLRGAFFLACSVAVQSEGGRGAVERVGLVGAVRSVCVSVWLA